MNRLETLLYTQVVRGTSHVKPDRRIWLFSSDGNSHYNYNSRYLFEYVKDNLPGIRPYFVINDPVLREKLSAEHGEKYFIETRSAKGIRKALRAGVWFTSAGLPVYGQHLNKDRLIVNLWHGVPLKKIALLDPNLKPSSRIYFHRIFSENYTHILTTADTLVPVMSESFDVKPEIVRVWGQPRNDVMFAPNDREALLNGIYKNLPEYKKLILYAPTFRDGGRTRLFPFPDYEKKAFETFLEENGILLFLRTHIKEQESTNRYLSDRVRFLGNKEAEDIACVLNIFDLLVTDYSSIYIDYLLLDRPEIFLPYDKEAYLSDRGMNFEYEKVTPGPRPSTMKEFEKEILDGLYGEDRYAAQRKKCCRFFNQITEPCCGRICREILKETGLMSAGARSKKE